MSVDPHCETSIHIDKQDTSKDSEPTQPLDTCEGVAALQVEVPTATLMPAPQ